jgi:hypothetical protein
MNTSVIKAAALAAAFGLAGAAHASTISVTDATYAKIDNATATRTLSVGTHGTISDVNITIDFSKCDDPAIGPDGVVCIGIGRAYPGEIAFQLSGPNGQGVDLVQQGTYSLGAGRVTVTFDDQAANPVGPVLMSGTYRPVGSLAAFNRMDMFGNWQLSLRDARSGDPLEYFSSQLEISSNGTSVPEPGSVAILSLGLLGLGAARGRKRSRA